MPLRPLSKELQEIAEKELNEVPSQVEESLVHIKNWISKQPHLKCPLDDQWLICFLRGCKFSLQKTKEKLDYYYTIRSTDTELFSNRDPFSPDIQEYMAVANIFPLPKSDNPKDPRTILIHTPHYDPDIFTPEQTLKAFFMSMDVLLHNDDYLSGQQALINLAAMDYKMMLHVPPSLLRKVCTYLLKAYPCRPKKVYFINTPPIFEKLVNFLKSYLPEKMSERLHVSNNKQLFEIHNYISQSILPNEYGGTAGTIQELGDRWKTELESNADWFKEDSKYGVDEAKRLHKSNEDATVMGTEGSFRTLCID